MHPKLKEAVVRSLTRRLVANVVANVGVVCVCVCVCVVCWFVNACGRVGKCGGCCVGGGCVRFSPVAGELEQRVAELQLRRGDVSGQQLANSGGVELAWAACGWRRVPRERQRRAENTRLMYRIRALPHTHTRTHTHTRAHTRTPTTAPAPIVNELRRQRRRCGRPSGPKAKTNNQCTPTPTHKHNTQAHGTRRVAPSRSSLCAQKTRHFLSVEAVAKNWLLGCQATDTMEDLCCTAEPFFLLMILLVHQSCSASNWHTGTVLLPLPTANFLPLGDHLQHSAAREMRRMASVGFHTPADFSVHTNAFRSCEQDTR